MSKNNTELARGKTLLRNFKQGERVFRRIINEQTRSRELARNATIYTRGGEIFSSITHGITALTAIAILVICLYCAVLKELGLLAIFSLCVYGICAVLCFAISTIYHALAVNRGKRVLRVLDHCSIYFIIAGTYTPIALIGIGGWVGWLLVIANWTLCALGTSLTAVDRVRFGRFAFICYLVMGWLVVVAIVPLIRALGFSPALWLLIAGGLAYTLGAVVFKLKGKYVHGIWHLFTLAGLVLQFFSILCIILQ